MYIGELDVEGEVSADGDVLEEGDVVPEYVFHLFLHDLLVLALRQVLRG